MIEKRYSYVIRTYLNASHAMRWPDQLGQRHPHTWEIICQIKKRDVKKFIKFNQMEDQISAALQPFQNQFLNKIAPFDHVNPSLENLTDYFFDQINAQLESIDCVLLQLQLGESPTRFYRIDAAESGF